MLVRFVAGVVPFCRLTDVAQDCRLSQVKSPLKRIHMHEMPAYRRTAMRHVWLWCVFLLLVPATKAAAQPATACTSGTPYGNNQSAGRYASVGGVRVYYEVYGAGPALVVMHGNGGSIARMICQIDVFRGRHRVIAMDTRGHGKSDAGEARFTFEQQADDVAAILDQERIEAADLLGQSDGAIIALIFGIRHPNRARKIVASAPNLWPESDALWQWAIDGMKNSVAEADRMIAAGDQSRNWLLRKRQIELDIFQPHVPLDAVRTITAPTLLIGADEDLIRPEHYLAIYRNLQRGQLFIMPGTTHVGLTGADHELFNQVVGRFLDQPFSRPSSRR